MTEFSESIYLHSQDRHDGIDWLRRNDLEGYVFEPVAGWVQVLPKWPGFFNYDEEALKNSPKLLVYYVFGETDRWLAWIYEDNTRFFEYMCSLGGDCETDLRGASPSEIETRLRLADGVLESLLSAGDKGSSPGEGKERAARFCEALKLPNYSETSFEYAREEPPSNDFDVIYVDDQKQLRAGEDSEFIERLEQMSVDADKMLSTVAEGVVMDLLERDLMELVMETDAMRQTASNLLVDQVSGPTLPAAVELVEPWQNALAKSPIISEFSASDEQVLRIIERVIQAAKA